MNSFLGYSVYSGDSVLVSGQNRAVQSCFRVQHTHLQVVLFGFVDSLNALISNTTLQIFLSYCHALLIAKTGKIS